jgi:hypothetical protein
MPLYLRVFDILQACQVGRLTSTSSTISFSHPAFCIKFPDIACFLNATSQTQFKASDAVELKTYANILLGSKIKFFTPPTLLHGDQSSFKFAE